MRKQVFLAILFITIFCTQALCTESVIQGRSDTPGETLSFTFPIDYFSGAKITFPVKVKEDGTFLISLDIDFPLAGEIQSTFQTSSVFIYPNDTLYLSLTGDLIGFEGEHAIENEFLASYTKNRLAPVDVQYEMSAKNIDEFREWISANYNQWQGELTNLKSRNQVSDAFETYINSEIDYSFGYNLLRYRVEYPIANDLVPPMELPEEYINIIGDLLVNNTKGIASPSYRLFLDEYIDMTRELEDLAQLTLVEENFKIVSKTSPLFAQPDVPPIYQTLEEGDIVKFLGERSDFKTKSRIGGEISEDYWYKIRIANGREGWILGHTVEKVEKATSQNEDPIKKEVTTISKVVTKAVTIYGNVEVLNDPHERKVITRLPYGMEVDFPHVSTTENLPYRFEGLNWLGKFVMVDINGEVGWVFENLIKTQRKVVQISEQRQIVTLAALDDYSSLDQFLVGTPLYYYIAKDLKARMKYAQDDNLKRDIENFLNISEDENINAYIRFHYNELFGTSMDFELTQEDIQLVNLNLTEDDKEGVLVAQMSVDDDIEVYENYVVLPEIDGNSNTYETRVVLADPSSIDINVIADPLTGSLQSLKTYGLDNKNNIIAYDQASNEIAFLKYGNESRPIYLTAGADIQVGLDQHKEVVFEDDINRFMNGYYNQFHKEDQSVIQRIRTLDEIEFKTFIIALTKQKLTYLKESAKRMSLSDAFIRDMNYDINYWMGHQLLRFTQDRPRYDKSWVLPKKEINYYDFLSQIDINPVNRTLGPNYRNFIKSYVNYYQGLVENRNIPVKRIIEEQFNGYSYYYLMATELYADVFRSDPVHNGKAIAQFIQVNPYQNLSESLSTVYTANLPLRAGAQAPYFELKDSKGQIVRQTDYIGKIVVLDFWATWCAPCLEKMRTDREIWDKYDSEDVVFLYVSLDSNTNTWKTFLQNNTMIKGVHAIPNDMMVAFDSRIAQAYKITSIPAFYIIGKDGNLAYNPFTTLSPKRIRDHIDNLLYPR